MSESEPEYPVIDDEYIDARIGQWKNAREVADSDSKHATARIAFWEAQRKR